MGQKDIFAKCKGNAIKIMYKNRKFIELMKEREKYLADLKQQFENNAKEILTEEELRFLNLRTVYTTDPLEKKTVLERMVESMEFDQEANTSEIKISLEAVLLITSDELNSNRFYYNSCRAKTDSTIRSIAEKVGYKQGFIKYDYQETSILAIKIQKSSWVL